VATTTQRSAPTDKHLKNSITYTIAVWRDRRPNKNVTFHPECSPNHGKTFSTSITIYLCRSPAKHDRGRRHSVLGSHPRTIYTDLSKENSIFLAFILFTVLTPKSGPLPMVTSPSVMFTSPKLSSCRTNVIFILLTSLQYKIFQHSLQSFHTTNTNTTELLQTL